MPKCQIPSNIDKWRPMSDSYRPSLILTSGAHAVIARPSLILTVAPMQ